jgi:hypothetical protein
MSIRETSKIVTIKGDRWKIGKFDARTGSYIAYKLLFQLLPMGMELNLQKVAIESGQSFTLPEGRSTMSKDEFIEIQTECLLVCSKLIMVGEVETAMPILMQGGRWGIEGISDDIFLVMMLTIHCLAFNVSGFFDEDTLKELKENVKGLSLFSMFNVST